MFLPAKTLCSHALVHHSSLVHRLLPYTGIILVYTSTCCRHQCTAAAPRKLCMHAAAIRAGVPAESTLMTASPHTMCAAEAAVKEGVTQQAQAGLDASDLQAQLQEDTKLEVSSCRQSFFSQSLSETGYATQPLQVIFQAPADMIGNLLSACSIHDLATVGCTARPGAIILMVTLGVQNGMRGCSPALPGMLEQWCYIQHSMHCCTRALKLCLL